MGQGQLPISVNQGLAAANRASLQTNRELTGGTNTAATPTPEEPAETFSAAAPLPEEEPQPQQGADPVGQPWPGGGAPGGPAGPGDPGGPGGPGGGAGSPVGGPAMGAGGPTQSTLASALMNQQADSQQAATIYMSMQALLTKSISDRMRIMNDAIQSWPNAANKATQTMIKGNEQAFQAVDNIIAGN